MLCKHSVDMGWRLGWRSCRRPATKDGYCTRHHPDYEPPSHRAAREELEREEADPEYRAQKWIDEAKAHRQICYEEAEAAQHRLADAFRAEAEAEQRLKRIQYPRLFKRDSGSRPEGEDAERG